MRFDELETDLTRLGGLRGAEKRYGYGPDPELDRAVTFAKIHRAVRKLMAGSAVGLSDIQILEINRLLRGGA